MNRTTFVQMTAAKVLRPQENETAQRHAAKAARETAEKLADELGLDAELIPVLDQVVNDPGLEGRIEQLEDERRAAREQITQLEAANRSYEKDARAARVRIADLEEQLTAPKRAAK